MTTAAMPVSGFEAAPAREARIREVLEHAREIEGRPLTAGIPSACYEPRVARGLVGFGASYALWAGASAAAYVAHPALWVPLWLVAGLGGWGLHCIAHDCGHGSFSSSRRLNGVVGHLALLPLLYPFHAWRHVHNLHHASTNSLEKDTDWRPVDAATYARMPRLARLVYAGTRSLFFWLGTVHYQLVSGYRPSFFPQAKARAEVRRSILFVVAATAVLAPLLVHLGGAAALLTCFLGPWIGTHAWFSVTTLMHHTDEDVPFLAKGEWSLNASKLLLTTDYRYPAWLHFLTHNISVHAAHHVAPKIPFYNLPRAQQALKEAFPGMLRERPFSFGDLFRIVTRCHLYEASSRSYHPFSAAAER